MHEVSTYKPRKTAAPTQRGHGHKLDATGSKVIRFRVSTDLADRIERAADRHFGGNVSELLRQASEVRLVALRTKKGPVGR